MHLKWNYYMIRLSIIIKCLLLVIPMVGLDENAQKITQYQQELAQLNNTILEKNQELTQYQNVIKDFVSANTEKDLNAITNTFQQLQKIDLFSQATDLANMKPILTNTKKNKALLQQKETNLTQTIQNNNKKIMELPYNKKSRLTHNITLFFSTLENLQKRKLAIPIKFIKFKDTYTKNFNAMQEKVGKLLKEMKQNPQIQRILTNGKIDATKLSALTINDLEITYENMKKIIYQ